MVQKLEGHHARKRFGQNFLNDPHWIGKIVDSIDPQPEQVLIEIGPGQAALTREIIAKSGHETTIEIDRDLAAWLRSIGRKCTPGKNFGSSEIFPTTFRARFSFP